MARRTFASPPPQPANLTVEQMRRGIEALRKRVDDLEAFDVSAIVRTGDPRITALSTSIEETLQRVYGAGSLDATRYAKAAELHRQWGVGVTYTMKGIQAPSSELQREFSECKDNSVALLKQAIKGLEERIANEEASARIPASLNPGARDLSKIFIVHGRDDGPREAVARFLERLGFEAIILHERANQGRTVIEKVEAHSDVGFAVILLTPDDEGNLKGETPQPRARQNVLLELGYFIGKLTRARVCTLKVGDLEIPSDWRGVVDEPFDSGGAWKQTLARELDAAGYNIDWNKVMR